MEGCSGSHYWARLLIGLGFEVKLIPPHYVTPYRRRNKTDRADCEAILEADRCAGIHGITVKSEAQQAIMTLHRVRSQWMATRTARINGMRGMLRELGVTCALGAERFLTDLHQVLERNRERLPERIRRMVTLLWEEVRELERRIEAVEEELERIAKEEPVIRTLLQVPGIGVLTATALYASVGDVHAFKSGRHLASWLGLTPAREVQRRAQAPWQDHQAGRPVPAHPAHPRRAIGAAGRGAGSARGALADAPAGVGARTRRRGPHQPSGRRARQQARAHRVGRLAPRAQLRRQPRTTTRRRLSQARATERTQRRGSGRRNDVDQEEEGPAGGSARREHRTTWQSGRTGAGVKPLTSACLRGRCSDWHPAREFHVGPEPRGSTPEAVYTTAARPPAVRQGCSPWFEALDEREESIYDC
jgi:hypothetical protein